MLSFVRVFRSYSIFFCALILSFSINVMFSLPSAAVDNDLVRSWHPSRTKVFVVGVLKWQDKSYLQFTTKARRDAQLVEFFKAKGVPEENIVYLSDSEATLNKV